MKNQEYTPAQALQVLLEKIRDRDPQFVLRVQSAIDAGKDAEESDSPRARGRRKKQRVYRKTVRLTDTEALHVAMEVLQAYFIEQPLFVKSAAENFRPAALSTGQPLSVSSWLERKPITATHTGAGSDKTVEVELQPETQITSAIQEALRLEPVPQDVLREQEANLEHLRQLLEFGNK